jgi:hypothetical protein
MFAQVIQGRTADAAALRRRGDDWVRELGPGATGWLGATGGVTDEGDAIMVVRFESEEAARANSDRPEQGAWWAETAKLYEGEVTFHDCHQVDLFLGGGTDDAGFVQVIQGRGDREPLQAAAGELETFLRRTRPDVLGGIIAWHGDGTFTQTVYFPDEASARAGEAQELSPEDAEFSRRFLGQIEMTRFFDLRDPWIVSAPG